MDREGFQSLQSGLMQLRGIQRCFDEKHFSGAPAGEDESKRRHIGFHVTILAAKLARLEERADHGDHDESVLYNEVIPDLLVYAAQLSELHDIDLADAYISRLHAVEERERPQSSGS